MMKSDEDINKAYKIGYEFTEKLINDWEIKYNILIIGKLSYDIIKDDKNINYSEDLVKKNFNNL